MKKEIISILIILFCVSLFYAESISITFPVNGRKCIKAKLHLPKGFIVENTHCDECNYSHYIYADTSFVYIRGIGAMLDPNLSKIFIQKKLDTTEYINIINKDTMVVFSGIEDNNRFWMAKINQGLCYGYCNVVSSDTAKFNMALKKIKLKKHKCR